jgi:hypothetical protein
MADVVRLCQRVRRTASPRTKRHGPSRQIPVYSSLQDSSEYFSSRTPECRSQVSTSSLHDDPASLPRLPLVQSQSHDFRTPQAGCRGRGQRLYWLASWRPGLHGWRARNRCASSVKSITCICDHCCVCWLRHSAQGPLNAPDITTVRELRIEAGTLRCGREGHFDLFPVGFTKSERSARCWKYAPF